MMIAVWIYSAAFIFTFLRVIVVMNEHDDAALSHNWEEYHRAGKILIFWGVLMLIEMLAAAVFVFGDFPW